MMTIRMRPLAAAVLTLSAAFGLTTVSTATAAADSAQCPVGEFCLWEHSSYQGRFAYSSEPQPNVGNYMNDRMTSYWNRTDHSITIYDDDKFEGCMMAIAPGMKVPAIMSWYNDLTTSFRAGNFC
ncbi:peptidase inhibitor family I36 protein [Streptomyces sp. NPDC003016]